MKQQRSDRWPIDVWWTTALGYNFEPTDPIVHIARKGLRSWCGHASFRKGGWIVIAEGAADPEKWRNCGERAPKAICVECLRRMPR